MNSMSHQSKRPSPLRLWVQVLVWIHGTHVKEVSQRSTEDRGFSAYSYFLYRGQSVLGQAPNWDYLLTGSSTLAVLHDHTRAVNSISHNWNDNLESFNREK